MDRLPYFILCMIIQISIISKFIDIQRAPTDVYLNIIWWLIFMSLRIFMGTSYLLFFHSTFKFDHFLSLVSVPLTLFYCFVAENAISCKILIRLYLSFKIVLKCPTCFVQNSITSIFRDFSSFHVILFDSLINWCIYFQIGPYLQSID